MSKTQEGFTVTAALSLTFNLALFGLQAGWILAGLVTIKTVVVAAVGQLFGLTRCVGVGCGMWGVGWWRGWRRRSTWRCGREWNGGDSGVTARSGHQARSATAGHGMCWE